MCLENKDNNVPPSRPAKKDLITNNDETAFREKMRALRVWCQENNLTLNKTKEMIVDFRKQQREHTPIHTPHQRDSIGEGGKLSSSAYTSKTN
jgi:hypothetical protein